jgi:hypothetical protein
MFAIRKAMCLLGDGRITNNKWKSSTLMNWTASAIILIQLAMRRTFFNDPIIINAHTESWATA